MPYAIFLLERIFRASLSGVRLYKKVILGVFFETPSNFVSTYFEIFLNQLSSYSFCSSTVAFTIVET